GWLGRGPDGGTAVINVGDPGGAAVAERLADTDRRIVATRLIDGLNEGVGGAADIETRYATRAGAARPIMGRIVESDRDGTTIEVHGLGGREGRNVRLATAGRHNAVNALGVAAAASV